MMLRAPVPELSRCQAHCSKPRRIPRPPSGSVSGVPLRLSRSHRVTPATAPAFPAEALFSTHSGSSYNSSIWSYDIEEDAFQADVAVVLSACKNEGCLAGIGSPLTIAVQNPAVGSSLVSNDEDSCITTDDCNVGNSNVTNTANSSSASVDAHTVV